jgi:hypothetical protein
MWILEAVILIIFTVAVLILLLWLNVRRVRRIERETGVRYVGRDELTVDIGNRRYCVFSELGSPSRTVETGSVRDITDSPSIYEGVEADPQTAEEVISRVRTYYLRRRQKVEYR